MSNRDSGTQAAGVSASETSNPAVSDTLESTPCVYVGSEYYNCELAVSASADPATYVFNAEDCAAERPPKRRLLSRQASTAEQVNRGCPPASLGSSESSTIDTPESGGTEASTSRFNSPHSRDIRRDDTPESDGDDSDASGLDNLENANIHEIDVSRFTIPRLDINGRVIPGVAEPGRPPIQGPQIDNAELDPRYRQVHAPVEPLRASIPRLVINGHRLFVRLELESDHPHPDDAASDNRNGTQTEPARLCWLAQQYIRFRNFFNNVLPTLPTDRQANIYIVTVVCYILLCELAMFMAVILSAGAFNIILQMKSGPRAVSQQILKDIPFEYLEHLPVLFSITISVDGLIEWALGPPEGSRLRRFPMCYLHLQSARLWMPIANILLDLFTAISLLNCTRLGYKLLSAS